METGAFLIMVMVLFAMLVLFMAAVPLAFCYLTPVSVAIKEVDRASCPVHGFFKALVFLPAIAIMCSYAVPGAAGILTGETARIVICWTGAVLSRFPSRRTGFYRYAFWLYAVAAAIAWLTDEETQRAFGEGFGRGFVGPT